MEFNSIIWNIGLMLLNLILKIDQTKYTFDYFSYTENLYDIIK